MDEQEYKRINISLPSDLLDKFEQFCRSEGMMLSTRIAVLIRKDLTERDTKLKNPNHQKRRE